MSENFFSVTVSDEVDKISALSGMMMAVGTGDVTDLDGSEISAIGSMLCDIRDKLREWNHEEGDIDQSLLDSRDANMFLSDLLRRAKSHRKTEEIKSLLLDALSQIQKTNQHIQGA